MKKLWRLLNVESKDPYNNMAVDEALLTAVERNIASNTIRFWRNPNAVVIGYSQSVEREVYLTTCKRHGASIVRRFTGGGAVYQDYGNLNWSVFAVKEHLPFGKVNDVIRIFEVFGKPLVEGLKTLDIHAEFRLPNSIYVGNKKISGMAAYVKRKSVLCHGTLLVNTDLDMLANILKFMKAEVTTLRQELSKQVSITDVKSALIKGFNMELGINLKTGRLSKSERAIMKPLRKKYDRQKKEFCELLRSS